MTLDDFKVFRRELCGAEESDHPGYYPTMPFGNRMARLWFDRLQRYALLQCLRALEQYARAHPRQEPSLDGFVEVLQALTPARVPVQPWFAQAQADAMREASYGGVLRSLLPPEGSQAWAKCWCWLFDQGLTRPGREAACAEECRRLAETYPRDREDWLRQAWQLEEQAARRT